MAVIKITFDGSTVTSKQDADLNHFLSGKENGVIIGLGGNITYSAVNNNITFSNGYAQVYGRRVFVESGTKISVSLDSDKYGYVFIKYDLGNNRVTLEKRESSGYYPSLIQEDLSSSGLVYELALCRYHKTTTSLNLDQYFQRSEIIDPKTRVENSEESTDAKIDKLKHFVISKPPKSKNSYIVTFPDGVDVSKILLIIQVNSGTFVPMPGKFAKLNSTHLVQYSIDNKFYGLEVEWTTSSKLSLTPSDTSHKIEWIYVYR